MFKRDENYKEFTYAIIFFITTIPIHSGMPSYARSLTRIFTKCYEICLHIKKSSFFFFLPFFSSSSLTPFDETSHFINKKKNQCICFETFSQCDMNIAHLQNIVQLFHFPLSFSNQHDE